MAEKKAAAKRMPTAKKAPGTGKTARAPRVSTREGETPTQQTVTQAQVNAFDRRLRMAHGRDNRRVAFQHSLTVVP